MAKSSNDNPEIRIVPELEKLRNIRKLTEEGKEHYKEWKHFKRHYDVTKIIPDAIAGRLDYTRPEPPSDPRDIQNFGKPIEQQKFPYYTIEYKAKMEYWMDENHLHHDKYLKFIEEEDRRLYEGFWFFNGGNLEYITGYNYIFLQYWLTKVTKKINGRDKKVTSNPSFRDMHRDIFYAYDKVKMDDRSHGLIFFSYRRAGKTLVGIFLGYIETIMYRDQAFTMQSKNESDGKSLFRKIIASWKTMPKFYKPNDAGDTSPQKELLFAEGKRKLTVKEREYSEAFINSEITYESSSDAALDGLYFSFIFHDEIGKSFSINELVRMGDGSVKRVADVEIGDVVLNPDGVSNVINLTKGIGNMYKVKGYSFDDFTCNEAHDLILEWRDNSKNLLFNGGIYIKGDTVVMEVREYLTLSKSKQTNLRMFRKFTEFDEQELLIDPYYFGAWIGDGISNTSAVCGVDYEIHDYINELYDGDCSFRVIDENSGLAHILPYNTTKYFRELGVYKNKHIPTQYLHNSEENRLQLLAGLLDTDGCLIRKSDESAKEYAFIQTKEQIADEVRYLCNSLGFKATKTKTSKEMNGKIFNGFRINIYGDLKRIPCKIERKIAKEKTGKSLDRNPIISGFTVEYVGVDDFYGFELDRNHEMYLEDGILVHNCKTGIDVSERWNIAKECLSDGTIIIGKAYVTTTVEDMEKYASALAEVLWERSDVNNTDPILNRTDSGLYQLFFPAYYGIQGYDGTGTPFMDEFGYTDVKRAHDYITEMYAFKKGNDLLSFRRKFPLTISDVFALAQGRNNFSKERIYEQKKYNEEMPISPIVKGNFTWANGIKDSTVVFNPDEKGRWEVSWMPNLEDRSKYEERGGQRSPTRFFARTGCDPFNQSFTRGKGSLAAATTTVRGYYKNPKADNGIACTYLHRQQYSEDFFEDMILQSVFYSSLFLAESNKDGVLEHFRKRGYNGFAMKDPLERDHKQRAKPARGIPMSGDSKRNAMVDSIQSFVYDYVGLNTETKEYGWVPHNNVLNELLRFDAGYWRVYDLTVSLGMSLLAWLEAPKKKKKTKDMSAYFNVIKK